MYKCSICGKEYENAVDRATCELKCDREKREELERERKNQLMVEEKSRFQEIMNDYNNLQMKIDAYLKDYGESPMTFKTLYSANDMRNIIGLSRSR